MAKQASGMEPWVMVSKAFAFRYGPAHVPLPGCATLVSVVDKGIEVYISAMPINEHLKKGINPKDLPTFLTTTTGLEYFKSSCVFFRVPANGVAYIPYGWSVAPLIVLANFLEVKESEKADAEEKRDKDREKITSGLVFTPVMNRAWAKAMPAPCWAAIDEWNDGYLQTVANKRVWASRASMWTDFSQDVKGE